MHQALYRKWRPSTFEDVVGQEHITQVLKYEIEQGSFSHAYGEIVVPVKMPVTRSRTERPHGALLQLDIEFRHCTYRIGGRLRY